MFDVPNLSFIHTCSRVHPETKKLHRLNQSINRFSRSSPKFQRGSLSPGGDPDFDYSAEEMFVFRNVSRGNVIGRLGLANSGASRPPFCTSVVSRSSRIRPNHLFL